MSMRIFNLIDKYVEVCAKRKKLEEIIEVEDKGIIYAQVERDTSYFEKNFDWDIERLKSLIIHRVAKNEAQKELSQVKQLLDSIHQSYMTRVESFDSTQLKGASLGVEAKVYDIKRRMETLSKRYVLVTKKGDEAFANHDYAKEKEYNRIGSECRFESERIRSFVPYYNLFIDDLNRRATKKEIAEYNYGATARKR